MHAKPHMYEQQHAATIFGSSRIKAEDDESKEPAGHGRTQHNIDWGEPKESEPSAVDSRQMTVIQFPTE